MSDFPPWREKYENLLIDIEEYLLWFSEDCEQWKAKYNEEFKANLDAAVFKAFRSGLIKVSAEKDREKFIIPLAGKDEEVISPILQVQTGLVRYPQPSSPQEQAINAWLKQNTTPAFIYSFHPELPEWAVAFFSEILESYRALGQREYLRRVGLDTGVLPPITLQEQKLLERVLALRGCQDTLVGSLSEPREGTETAGKANTVIGILEELRLKRRIRSFEQIREYSRKIEERKLNSKIQKSRVRKQRGSWGQVIRILVKEGLLEKPISPQGFKKMLRKKFPWIDWDKV